MCVEKRMASKRNRSVLPKANYFEHASMVETKFSLFNLYYIVVCMPINKEGIKHRQFDKNKIKYKRREIMSIRKKK